MTTKLIIKTFILTILIAFASSIIPKVIILTNQSSLIDLGDLSNYRSICSEIDKDLKCTDQFSIPINNENHLRDFAHLGIGKVLSYVKYYCSESKNRSYTIGNLEDSNKSKFLLNKYITIHLAPLDCKTNLIIQAWSKIKSKRTGYQYGPLVLADENTVSLIKSSFEFFSHDFYILSFIILFLSFMISRTLGKQDLTARIFIRSNPYWFLYLFLSTGYILVLFPLPYHMGMIALSIKVMSLLAHMSITTNYIKFYKSPTIYRLSFFILVVLSLLALKFHFFIEYYILLIAINLLLLISNWSLVFFLFQLCLINSLMKFVGYNVIPSARLTAVFLSILQLNWIFTVLRNNSASKKKLYDFFQTTSDKYSFIKNQEALDKRMLAHDLMVPIVALEHLRGGNDNSSVLLDNSIERLKKLQISLDQKKEDISINLPDLVTKAIKEYEIIFDCESSINLIQMEYNIDAILYSKLSRSLENIIDNAVEEGCIYNENTIFISMTEDTESIVIQIKNNSSRPTNKILHMLNNGIAFTKKKDGHGYGTSFSYDVITNDLKGVIYYEYKKPYMITTIELPK